MAQYPFKACIRVYGIPNERAEEFKNWMSAWLNPLIKGVRLCMRAAIDEEYNHESAHCEPVIVFYFEMVAPSVSFAADLQTFLWSLARILDARYSDIKVDYRTDL